MLKLMRRIAILAIAAMASIGCEPTNQGYTPVQPIEYSHAVHAGVNKIPCRYCHYTANRSRFAGIPPATLCMNCHKQVQQDHPEVKKISTALETGEPIQWIRVHRVPDHVYFDHSVHVNSDVECQQCHGPVESMGRVTQWAPLTMGWCLECHRTLGASPAGAKHTSPLVDCAVCHH